MFINLDFFFIFVIGVGFLDLQTPLGLFFIFVVKSELGLEILKPLVELILIP